MVEMNMLSVKDVADKLKMTEQNVRNIIRKGDIVACRIGKQWVISENDLESFVNSKRYVPDPDDHPRRNDSIPDFVALSFFSGAMGLDLGMEKAGIHALLACEFDKNCRRTISANRPDIALIGDIRKYTADQVMEMAKIPKDHEIDLIFGGPPCQAFSIAGEQKGFNDERGNLFLNIIDLISSIILICILLPLYGIAGYLIVLFISEILNASLSIFILLHSVKIKFDYKKLLLRPIFVLFFTVILTNIFKFETYSIFFLILDGLVFAIFYFLFSFMFNFISKEDLRL